MFRAPASAFRVGEELLQEHHLTVSRTARYFTLGESPRGVEEVWFACHGYAQLAGRFLEKLRVDRKSTRLNSSHRTISYAVFCLKKKKKQEYVYISDHLPTRTQ